MTHPVKTLLLKKTILALSMTAVCLSIHAQLVINEFMASNSTVYADEYGEYDDWIEIYNVSDQLIELEDYYITDDFGNPDKYNLPESMSIGPHEYLIIVADEDGEQGNHHANFKLDKEAEEIAIVRISGGGEPAFIDSLSYSDQITDISYGRFPDGGSGMEYFSNPTPGAANQSDAIEGIAPEPEFSLPGGFYSGPLIVEISTSLEGSEIRYTLDGSEPDAGDELYSSPLNLDSTTVVKARIFAGNYLPGPTHAKTYFIDELFVDLVPADRMFIASISTDPDLLWDPDNGLLHDNNEFNTWEYPANVELFDPDGNTVINQKAGLRLFGNSSRMMDQKSVAVIARNEYGDNRFNYPLFADRPFEVYKSFVLRNSGNDWSSTYMRDAVCQKIIRNDMDIDAQSSTQGVLYMNGRFYGLVNLKEKINEHYLEAHHGIDPDKVNMLVDWGQPVYGETEEYFKFNGFVARNDMSDDRLYHQLGSMMQLEEYRNLYIAQIYLANIDMFLNQKYWKEPENQSRWRWIIYDTEISFGQGDYYTYTTDYGTLPWDNTFNFATTGGYSGNWPYLRPWSTEKIVSLLENKSFRDDFIQTFAVHLNTTFKTDRVRKIIDSLAHRVRLQMPDQIKAYGGHRVDFNPYGYHFTSMEQWEDKVDTLELFANQRPDYLRTFIPDRFGLEGTFELTPTMSDPDAGTILIQDLVVPLDTPGIYFAHVPLRIRVTPREGYRFVKWTGVDIPDSLSPVIRLERSENTLLEAHFEPEAELMITEINYAPEGDPSEQYVEIYNPKHSTDIDLEGYSLQGDVEFTFPEGSSIKAMSYLTVVADSGLDRPNISVFQWTVGQLDPENGLVKLADPVGVYLDSVNYLNSSPWPEMAGQHSIELMDPLLDNSLGSNWQLSVSAGGSAGIPVFDASVNNLVINEFMSFNDDFYFDEYNEFNDWIEILNTGDTPVDIGGMFITNDLDTPAMYQIPTNDPLATTIQAGEYKILWADRDIGQGALHLSFNLNKGGSEVGISADGKNYIDFSDSIAVINSDISFGRYPDAAGAWQVFDAPTPESYNSLPPVFLSVPEESVAKRTDYRYEIVVSDPDDDELILGIYTIPSWLYYLPGEDPPVLSGRSPTGSFNPVSVKIFVTDGHSKPVDQEWIITQAEPDIFEELSLGEVNIYPNPSTGAIHLTAVTGEGQVSLHLFNMAGMMVWQDKVSHSDGYLDMQIDLSDMEKGLYILHITTEERSDSHKIILY